MEIYIDKDGQVLDPYYPDEIQKRLDDGWLDGAELAWHEGLEAWVNVKELLDDETPPKDDGDPVEIYDGKFADLLAENGTVKPQYLQLTHLDLSSNQISDVSALKELTQLTELQLSNNQISDVSPLKELTQLTRLTLGVNQISDSDKEDLDEALPDCNIRY